MDEDEYPESVDFALAELLTELMELMVVVVVLETADVRELVEPWSDLCE
jgi:hypothetical protein